ncbi:ABC transporter ATP-binding protein [Thiomicrorhabdus aquaedulcis]|uniref:ABC transporter ATP-binding protein n=1 Tax=Thiomicrorhabdus aquaedulcis TaxID=2211106 RepID=UPI000FD9BCDE|nr:ATP-binding cassette domain-containing protein [Thiomicrorhabdus aquaedulcis]
MNEVHNSQSIDDALTLINVNQLVTRFGKNTVHESVSFTVKRGEVVALIGGSGTGKSVLLREMVGLLRPTQGTVSLFNQAIWQANSQELSALRQRFGMLFQDGALFSSISVERNVATPLFEHTQIGQEDCLQLARLKLALVGLPASAAQKMPNELSGGMRKRVALARAMALDPELLFLDEPTSGLDPISARAFDDLVRTLADNLGLTVFLVTHDLDTLLGIVDRVIVLSAGKVLGDGTVDDIRRISDPWLTQYFNSRSDLEH